MRQLVYSALIANADLQAILGNRIYASGALGVDNIPANPLRPYIQFSLGEGPQYATVRETSTSLAHPLRIYVYDNRGSFVRIDEIHRIVRQTVEGLGGMVSPSGRRCTDATFITLGGEDVVAALDANVRMAAYRLTGPQ